MTTPRTFALLALIVLTLATLAPARAAPLSAASQPAHLSFFGLNTYFTGLERNRRDGEAGVATLAARGRQIGAAWAREELSWGNLERNGKGLWEWEIFDRRLLVAADAGYGIVGMLLTTPAWARVGDCASRIERYAAAGVRSLDFWCPPANPQDYADYVGAVVERYDGDGANDAPGSPRVAAWQLWNEPNHWETWPGSPAEYAAILQAGYAAAKAADPSAIVATAGLYIFDGGWTDGVGHQDGLRFLDAAIAARPAIWGSFDALAVHPYMPDAAPDQPDLVGAVTLWGRLSTARSWLDRRTATYGGDSRPLWVSELGWSTCSAAEADCYAGAALTGEATEAERGAPSIHRSTPSLASVYAATTTDHELGTPESQQSDGRESSVVGRPEPTAELPNPQLAALIGKSEQQQANYLVRAHGIAMALGVQHMSWFQLEDKFDGSARNFWEEAAIFRTAAQGYAPKPAAVAYSTLSSQLGGASFVGFGPLHSFAYSPAAPSPTARFHLRFRTADNYLIDLIWRNSGTEVATTTVSAGATATLLDRDGAQQPLAIENGVARLSIGESPLYLRQSLPVGFALGRSQVTIFARPGDGPLPVAVTVQNSGSGNLSWSASGGAAWLGLSTPSGQGFTSALRITFDPGAVTPGDYRATIRLTGNGATTDLPVRFVVSPTIERSYLPQVGR
jgi:hypothetical protein